MNTRLLTVFTICFSTTILHAQVSVTPDLPAETLVQDFLLGSGVLIENVTFEGSLMQIGSFEDVDVLGLEAGFVMSTASAMNLADGGFADVFSGASFSDPSLYEVANSVPDLIGQDFLVSSIHDIAAVEFDFVPYGDSLNFVFSFGSDEYLEWVNSSFNDVFGFFLSGPGIVGPYSVSEEQPNGAINIALIPGSEPPLPITVSSVNNQINSEFYIDNESNTGVFLDGFTTPIQAIATDLEIGETYHMRLAIADGSDSALESAVFLKAGSFSAYESVSPGSLGDLDGDGDIDVADLLIIISNYACNEGDCTGDLDGNGVVGVSDILLFLGLFEG